VAGGRIVRVADRVPVRHLLGVLALPHHVGGLPRRRRTCLVLDTDVHALRIAVSFVLAWLRLKTGSLWPGVFLHGSHNLWMQSIFTPLTTEREYTKWIAGDLGIGLVIVTTVVAVVFWLKRGELPASSRT
jgi:membrane protease YdiL (CAAX protease family)